MSRSRKEPWYTDNGKHSKFAKRQANKDVRKFEDLGENMYYKRVYCSWDICDYKFYCPDDKKAYRK